MNDPRHYYRTPLGDGSVAYIYHPAEGTFHSAGEASYWVERTLLAHPDLVEAAKHLPVGSRPVVIHHRFGQETGREAFRESYFAPVIFRPTFAVEVLLSPDPSKRGRGFRILTAFPRNDRSNEVVR